MVWTISLTIHGTMLSKIRTARAGQELGAISEEQEDVARGLRFPSGLANCLRLIDLQTNSQT